MFQDGPNLDTTQGGDERRDAMPTFLSLDPGAVLLGAAPFSPEIPVGNSPKTSPIYGITLGNRHEKEISAQRPQRPPLPVPLATPPYALPLRLLAGFLPTSSLPSTTVKGAGPKGHKRY